jgi:hypothetical protein
MQADKVDISWDAAKSRWLVRIQTGEEVLLRHCDLPQNAGEPALRQAAQDTLKDEGYEPDGATITVQQPRVA